MTSIATVWNDLYQWFSSQNTAVKIPLITCAVGVLTFLINFGVKPLVSFLKRKWGGLSVKMGLSHVFEQNILFGGVKARSPIITCTITNRGANSVYVNRPLIKTSRKVNGDNTFSVVNMAKFPIKLEHGQVFTFECDAVSLENDVLFFLSPWDSIKFVVTTTTGKKYTSNSYRVKFIRSNIKTAIDLNRTKPNNF